MEKLKIEIDDKVDSIIKQLDEELDGDKEFSVFLIADKDNPYKIVDVIVPKQEVSGSSVDIPLINERSQYESAFVNFWNNQNNNLVVIGTLHSHHDMGSFHSGVDDDDVNNNAPFNLNEQLPFIDIVWSHEESKAWVAMKVSKGQGKRTFVVNPDNTEIKVIGTETTQNMMDEIKARYTDYEFDEDLFQKSISRKIDVKKLMERIKEKTYVGYNGSTSGINYGCNNDLQTRLGVEEMYEPKLHIQHNKKAKSMIVAVRNDFNNMFMAKIESWIEDGTKLKTTIDMSYGKGNYWRVVLDCKDKNTFRELKDEIEALFEDYKALLIDELVESEYQGGLNYDKGGFDNYIG